MLFTFILFFMLFISNIYMIIYNHYCYKLIAIIPILGLSISLANNRIYILILLLISLLLSYILAKNNPINNKYYLFLYSSLCGILFVFSFLLGVL